MRQLLFSTLIALALSAQTTTTSNLDKPPLDVDDALRARIGQFYDHHVQATPSAYRRAEQLVAEESKDDYYVMSKLELKSYRIGSIEYSGNFTRAKNRDHRCEPVLFPGVGSEKNDDGTKSGDPPRPFKLRRTRHN